MFNELKNKNLSVYTHYSFKKMNQFYGPLAQLVEQFPFKEWVDGSSPSRLTTYFDLGQIDWWIIQNNLVHPFI